MPLKVVLITGASSGVGRATALAYVNAGYKVAVTARRVDRLEDLVKESSGSAGEILPIQADVCDEKQMLSAIQAIREKWGRLDIVIANAGIGQRGSITDSDWDDLDVVLRTNIDGVLHTVRAAVPLLKTSGGGHIILISSVLSLAIGPYTTIYSAAKLAINGIGRGLRMELSADRIWVTTVLLGQTHSEFTAVRRGIAGRTASIIPTMTAEFVAARLLKEATRHHRTVTLRPFDHLINFLGTYFPPFMDRLLMRVYKPKVK